ncbi:MAG: prolipoprotein diacylglyceryl transferase [Prevotellaceae bacterium]|jgi:prolipoprotein diacylglyceryl transferase|nr:prolipoprotein diacylglyceryl transferase [Prevotellaceae bacterium]
MNHLLSVTWDFNPDIFTIGSYSFRYYSILFVLGFVTGFFIMRNFFRREQLPISLVEPLAYIVFFSAAIGARLGHCFFYDPEYYLSNPLKILMMWEGGLASHGGTIGILIGVWFFYIKKYGPKYGFNYFWLLDRVAIPTALAACFIRLGNLVNSEIYGIETSLPWGFIFVRRGEVLPKHPTQIYEALCYLLIFFLLLWIYRRFLPKLKTGMILGIFLILVFTSRFFIEFIKNTQVAFEEGMTLDMGQWLSIPFIIIGVGLVVYSVVNGKPAMLQVRTLNHLPPQPKPSPAKSGAVQKDGNRLGKKRRGDGMLHKSFFVLTFTGLILLGCTDMDSCPPWAIHVSNNITMSNDGNGTASSVPSDKAIKGVTVTITATPDPCYFFTGWTVEGGTVLLDNNSAITTFFVMPEEDVAIKATFELNVIDLSGAPSSDISGHGWNYNATTSVYTILDGTSVKVIGNNQLPVASLRRIEVEDDATVAITLDNVTITGLSMGRSPFLLRSGANVLLTLATGSSNTFFGRDNSAGIQVPAGTTLSIDGSGTLEAKGGDFGAGIGGGNNLSAGAITINSGVITATSSWSGAGIGGGNKGNGGNIAINGGVITAISNMGDGGAGIGGGANGNAGNITITNGTVVAKGKGAAGIGGGYGSSNGMICITGGTIEATATLCGAGIGGGSDGSVEGIIISGGTITAKGGDGDPGFATNFGLGGGGAGIGGGGGRSTLFTNEPSKPGGTYTSIIIEAFMLPNQASTTANKVCAIGGLGSINPGLGGSGGNGANIGTGGAGGNGSANGGANGANGVEWF